MVSDPATVPELTPAKRWLLVGLAGGIGVALLALGTVEGFRLATDLVALPPAITVPTEIGAALAQGVAACGFALLGLFPPVLARRHGRRDLSAPVVVVGAACLLLAPVLTFAIRGGTASYLESRGYRGETVDSGFRALFVVIRYTRPR